jgi:hypothetical protein
MLQQLFNLCFIFFFKLLNLQYSIVDIKIFNRCRIRIKMMRFRNIGVEWSEYNYKYFDVWDNKYR